MKVILCEDIQKLGLAGETKDVSDGFARNYLLPKNLVLTATAANLRKWESEKSSRLKKISKSLESAQELSSQLQNTGVEINVKAGREGHLFGSVTTSMISKALTVKGFSIDKKHIILDTPIKALGEHTVQVHLHSQVNCPLKVTVLASEVVEDAPAKK